jgi:hypothetical protein
MDDLYVAWNQKALEISKGLVPDWKSKSSEVHGMLEHVSGDDAKQFAKKCMEEGLTSQQVQEYANICDSVGSPHVYHFPDVKLTFSTSCIRYLYHALQIVKLSDNLPIVEIGGGYGGLALAVNYVATIKNKTIHSYTIIDLPNVQKLQEYYLGHFNLNFPVFFSTTCETPCFLVSNYALAEMGDSHRMKYVEDFILPYVQQGFMVWNSQASYTFLDDIFTYSVEEEHPKTGPDNKVIIFKLKVN